VHPGRITTLIARDGLCSLQSCRSG
jgi:hypothetical protein